MRNCTRLFYYVWHWNGNLLSVQPHRFTDKRAAERMFKRFPKDSEAFQRNRWTTQMDVRGMYKGQRVAYCRKYYLNGKVIIQETSFDK